MMEPFCVDSKIEQIYCSSWSQKVVPLELKKVAFYLHSLKGSCMLEDSIVGAVQ